MSNGPDDDRLDSARVAYIGIVAGAAIGLIVGAIVNARRSRERV